MDFKLTLNFIDKTNILLLNTYIKKKKIEKFKCNYFII